LISGVFLVERVGFAPTTYGLQCDIMLQETLNQQNVCLLFVFSEKSKLTLPEGFQFLIVAVHILNFSGIIFLLMIQAF
jgi:hypothetical protein